jgi:hypothetical protein
LRFIIESLAAFGALDRGLAAFGALIPRPWTEIRRIEGRGTKNNASGASAFYFGDRRSLSPGGMIVVSAS